MKTSITPEQIQQNWERFESLALKVKDDRHEPIRRLLAEMQDRIALAPASGKTSYHNAFPGGLVDHTLRVYLNAVALCDTFGWEVPKASLIIAALFHDLGKVGYEGSDEGQNYYVESTDDWRKNKLGEMYAFNNDIQFMCVPDRSLYLLQHYGVRLERDELLAIKLHDGPYVEANRTYGMKEPMLADILHMADFIACKQEKGSLPEPE